MSSRYEVEVKPVSATNLKNVNWRNGPIHPYAVIWIEPSQKYSTQVDKFGDTQPNWDETFVIPLPLFATVEDSMLYIDVLHAHLDSETKPIFIGSAKLRLEDVHNDVGIGHSINRTLKLKRPSSRPQGVIDVKVAIRDKNYPSRTIADDIVAHGFPPLPREFKPSPLQTYVSPYGPPSSNVSNVYIAPPIYSGPPPTSSVSSVYNAPPIYSGPPPTSSVSSVYNAPPIYSGPPPTSNVSSVYNAPPIYSGPPPTSSVSSVYNAPPIYSGPPPTSNVSSVYNAPPIYSGPPPTSNVSSVYNASPIYSGPPPTSSISSVYIAPPIYSAPPPASYAYGATYAQTSYSYGQRSYGYGQRLEAQAEEKKEGKLGMGAGLAIGVLAGGLGALALEKGVDMFEDKIADHAIEKVEEDFGFESFDD